MIEMFKTQNNMNPSFMNEIFREQVNMYNLRNNNEIVLPRIKTVNFGSESIRYRGPQLWFSFPQDIRNTESLSLFKSKIKKWHDEDCSCRLCRPFISNVGILSIFMIGLFIIYILCQFLYQTILSYYCYKLYIFR